MRTGPPEERSHGLAPIARAALGVALAAGVWARVRGLGHSSLANDEYYFVLSIHQILEHGFPAFDTGGAYVRGILVQYVTAPFMMLIDSDELAVRIPSVVFGLATVWVAWLFGRRAVGPKYAVALVAILLLSSWQVEFSRFGRMYAAFQLVTLGLATALYDAMSGKEGPRPYLVPALCFVALFTHQLAVVLVPLMFVPLIVPGAVRRFGGRGAARGYAAVAGAVAAFALVLRSIPFRTGGVENVFPADYSSAGSGMLHLPYFPFWNVFAEPLHGLVLVVVPLALIALAGMWLAGRRRTNGATVIALMMLVAAAAHFLLVAFLLGLALVLRYGWPRSFRRYRVATVLGVAAAVVALGWIAAASWMTYGLGDRSWIEDGGFLLFREAAVAAFVWPNPWQAALGPWLEELPVLAVAIGGALLLQVALRARRPLVDLARNPAFFVLYVLAALGAASPRFAVTRYTFFIYPIALAVLALSIRDLAELAGRRAGAPRPVRAAGVVVLLLVFAVGGDFHPRHLLRVDSPQALYRTDAFERHEVTWYPRDDFASPAAFIEASAGVDDAVIVQEAPSVSYYLDRPHAVYLDRSGTRFGNVSREGGTIDFWSGRPLLSTGDDVRAYTRCATTAWIVQMVGWTPGLDPEQVWESRLREARRIYEGADGAVEVVRADLAPSETCPEPEAE